MITNTNSRDPTRLSSRRVVDQECLSATRRDLCSVICTTYNHARYSQSSLVSIAAQDWGDIEIIIVDDGSVDGNVSVMLEALLELDRPFTLLIQENTGNPGQNANRALKAANGEYCCLMSLDDLLLPGCISRKILLMNSDKALRMVGNETYLTIDTAKPLFGAEVNNAVKRGRGFSASQMMELEYTEIGTFLLQGTVFRTEFIRSIGGFDEDIAGDDLNLRTKIWSIFQSHTEMRFEFIPEPGFVYRLHGSNINLNTLRQVKTVLDWRDRYFPDRPLPFVAENWLLFYIRRCYSTGETTELKKLLDGHAEARRIHDLYVGKWTNKLSIILSKTVRVMAKLSRLWA